MKSCTRFLILPALARRDVDMQLFSLLINASLSITISWHARSGPGDKDTVRIHTSSIQYQASGIGSAPKVRYVLILSLIFRVIMAAAIILRASPIRKGSTPTEIDLSIESFAIKDS